MKGVDNQILNIRKMKNAIFILFILLGYNTNAQTNRAQLPALYIEFKETLNGIESMYGATSSAPNDYTFVFSTLLIEGTPNMTDGYGLELTQFPNISAVVIPLANLSSYLANVGRPLLNTVQIRQEYTSLTSRLERADYFNEDRRDMYVVEKNTQTQTAKITKVYCSNIICSTE